MALICPIIQPTTTMDLQCVIVLKIIIRLHLITLKGKTFTWGLNYIICSRFSHPYLCLFLMFWFDYPSLTLDAFFFSSFLFDQLFSLKASSLDLNVDPYSPHPTT